MLAELGYLHEHTPRTTLLAQQIAEVDVDALDPSQDLGNLAQRAALEGRVGGFALQAERMAQGVVYLRGVEAHVQISASHASGAQFGDQRCQLDIQLAVGAARA